jgi:hypothetical protein
MWSRNPRLWLSILPEETGWYWYKSLERKKDMTVCLRLRESELGLLFCDGRLPQQIDQWPGIWQGPIKPEGE